MAIDDGLPDGEGKSVIMEATIDGVPSFLLTEQTFTQVMLTESLLSPTLQTQISLDDVIMTKPMKNYDLYKGKNFILSAVNPNINAQLDVSNVIFRLEKRKPKNRDTESYKLQATDKSLLTNQQKRITKQYYKMSPTAIVNDALNQVESGQNNTEPSDPVRDYVASNIHPFEVINAQADYALANGNDPSFLHYMTYENGGTHHFRSVKELTKLPTIETYVTQDMGAGNLLARSNGIMSYEFPCEFDLLSDIMNGVGKDSATSVLVNTITSSFNALGSSAKAILGSTLAGSVFSNKGTNDHSSETNYENPQQFRAARMALLRPDRISLRITVPFNPKIHVGNMIKVIFRTMEQDVEFEFGTGDYMIVSLVHNLRLGGYGITTLDLVARTVGDGEV